MTIDKIIGVIGSNVSYSISPAIQNAALKELQLDSYIYIPMPVSKYPYIRVKEAILGLRALGFLGANVTIPYKQAVVPYLDRLSDSSKAIGAVNTVVVDSEGRLVGHNTDGYGFINDLMEHKIDVENLQVLILGAGGAARAITYGLLSHGCKCITILNRTKTKADDIASHFKTTFSDCHLASGSLNKDSIKQIPHPDLIVNTTSVGMSENAALMPWDENVYFSKGQIVYDIIYNPAKTKLLHHAEANGAKAINGIGMLVHQAALSFKIWTGQTAPIDVMNQVALKELS